MTVPPVVGLEIGTSKVVALVGELREDGHVMITGMGEHPSTGVRKGEIIDLENAVICVRSVLALAEESAQVTIRQVHLALSGAHIQSATNRGAVPVLDSEGEITGEDIEEVMEVARAVNLSPDRDVLHTICQQFCIDDQQRVIQPEGMEGAKLSLDMLVLHGVRSRLHNTIRAVRSIPLAVDDVAFGGLCAALAVLTPEQKKSGVIVIDLGGGTTDYLAYAGNVVAAAGVLGVGGDHVTSDITIAFNIPMSRAEKLKRECGSAIISGKDPGRRVSLPAEGGFSGRSLSLGSLHTVMNARMDEVLVTVKKRLDAHGISHQVGAGVVLTGGGAHMKDITTLAEGIFDLPCTVGKPRHVSGLVTATEGAEFAVCAGLVQYGIRSQLGQRRSLPLGNWLKGLFGR